MWHIFDMKNSRLKSLNDNRSGENKHILNGSMVIRLINPLGDYFS